VDIDDQKVPRQAQCNGFGVSAVCPGHVTARLFATSVTKKCSETTTICECLESHCKSDESTGRSIEKWFPGMRSKALRMLAKCVTVHESYSEGNAVYIDVRLLICTKPIPENV
jgi:hypothetical protein